MTLLFVDGFDHYATADFLKKWTARSSATIHPSNGRRGGGCAYLATSNFGMTLTKSILTGSSFVMGVAARFSVFPTSNILFTLLDAGTIQCDLRANSDGTLSVTRNGTAVTGGTSVATLLPDAYNYIEWKVTIADSIAASSCIVRLNGADVITVATGQDLKSTANTTANQVRLGYSNNNGVILLYYDDFYFCNQSGSTNNDFLGDVRVDTLFPTAEGNYSDFTPSAGTDNALNVDEAAPNTTDYNSSTTLNHRDSFAMQDLAPLVSQTVYGVQVSAAVYKDDSGTRGMAPFVRSGAVDSADGTTLGLGTDMTYASSIFEQDPNGAIPWTEAAVNAAEAGVKVTL